MEWLKCVNMEKIGVVSFARGDVTVLNLSTNDQRARASNVVEKNSVFQLQSQVWNYGFISKVSLIHESTMLFGYNPYRSPHPQNKTSFSPTKQTKKTILNIIKINQLHQNNRLFCSSSFLCHTCTLMTSATSREPRRGGGPGAFCRQNR